VKTIKIRKIPYKQAKSEIALYFNDHHGEEITPSDLEEALGIEFESASLICKVLARENQIKEGELDGA